MSREFVTLSQSCCEICFRDTTKIDQTHSLHRDKLMWHACAEQGVGLFGNVFGEDCDVPGMAIVRLADHGSLVGFDSSSVRVWDSHVDGGRYTDLALGLGYYPADAATTVAASDKISDSILAISDVGVRIYSVDFSSGDIVVTWSIDAPEAQGTDSTSPTNGLTASPSTLAPTGVASFIVSDIESASV